MDPLYLRKLRIDRQIHQQIKNLNSDDNMNSSALKNTNIKSGEDSVSSKNITSQANELVKDIRDEVLTPKRQRQYNYIASMERSDYVKKMMNLPRTLPELLIQLQKPDYTKPVSNVLNNQMPQPDVMQEDSLYVDENPNQNGNNSQNKGGNGTGNKPDLIQNDGFETVLRDEVKKQNVILNNQQPLQNINNKPILNGGITVNQPTQPQVPQQPLPQLPSQPIQPQAPQQPLPQVPSQPVQPQVPQQPLPQVPSQPTQPQAPQQPLPQVPSQPMQPQVPQQPLPQVPSQPMQPQAPQQPLPQVPSQPIQPQAPQQPLPQVPTQPVQPQAPQQPLPQVPTQPIQPQVPQQPLPQVPSQPTQPQAPQQPLPQVPSQPTQPQTPQQPLPQVPSQPTQPQVPQQPLPQMPSQPTQPQTPQQPLPQVPSQPVQPQAPQQPLPQVPSQPTQPQVPQQPLPHQHHKPHIPHHEHIVHNRPIIPSINQNIVYPNTQYLTGNVELHSTHNNIQNNHIPKPEHHNKPVLENNPQRVGEVKDSTLNEAQAVLYQQLSMNDINNPTLTQMRQRLSDDAFELLFTGMLNLNDLSQTIKHNGKDARSKLILVMANASKQGFDNSQISGSLKMVSESMALEENNPASILKNIILLYLPWYPLQEGVGFKLAIETMPNISDFSSLLKVFIQTRNYGNVNGSLILMNANNVDMQIQCNENFPKEDLLERMKEVTENHTMQSNITVEQRVQMAQDVETQQAKVNLSSTYDLNPFLLLMAHSFIKNTIIIDGSVG